MKEYLQKRIGTFDDFIENLNKLCSVLFSYTFLLFLLFNSLVIFFLTFFIINLIGEKILGESENSRLTIVTFLIIHFFLGFIVFIDLITLGGLKRIKEKSISKFYLYVYRFYSFITLSTFYRPLLYNFIDNKYTRRLFFFSIPYIFIIGMGINLIRTNNQAYIAPAHDLIKVGFTVLDHNYDDLRKKYYETNPDKDKKVIKDISFEHFYLPEGISSFFIPITDEANLIIKEVEKISERRKMGLTFFKNNVSLEAVEKAKKDLSQKRLKLINERSELNKKLSKDKANIVFNNKIDTINKQLEHLTNVYKDSIDKISKYDIEYILNKYVNQFDITIGGRKIEKNNCVYYNHPNLDEMGVRCFFITDSLSKGFHKAEVIKKYYTKKDSIQEEKLILPLVKR